MKYLRPIFLFVDIGFILYWLITWSGWIPGEYLFPDYHNSLMVTWNWSFLFLDLLISATGLTAVYMHKRAQGMWKPMAFLSLVLTFTSGLQAIAFWIIQGWFDASWWLPNLFLLIYPLFFLPRFVREFARADQADVS